MTKKQFESKAGHLIAQTERAMRRSIDKAINCGAIDIEGAEDDYRLPKVFMTAICRTMAEQWTPLSPDLRAEVANLEIFL